MWKYDCMSIGNEVIKIYPIDDDKLLTIGNNDIILREKESNELSCCKKKLECFDSDEQQYQLITNCWKQEPKDRYTTDQIIDELENMITN